MTVNRFHAHPDSRLRECGDTILVHQSAVEELARDLCLVMSINPSEDLLFACLHHDEAETILGDMPATAKRRFPALAAAYAKAELEILTEMGYTWSLTRQDADILKLCDMLDAYKVMLTFAPDLASQEGWQHDLAEMRKIAERLGGKAMAWLLGETHE